MQANLEREGGLGPLPFDSSPRDDQETKDFVLPRLFDPVIILLLGMELDARPSHRGQPQTRPSFCSRGAATTLGARSGSPPMRTGSPGMQSHAMSTTVPKRWARERPSAPEVRLGPNQWRDRR